MIPSPADGLAPADIDELLHHSQLLWRETSYEKLIQKFCDILSVSFAVNEVSLFAVRRDQEHYVIQLLQEPELKVVLPLAASLEVAAALEQRICVLRNKKTGVRFLNVAGRSYA